MSGAASSSTMAGLYSLPQKCVNQRPTMALLSSCLDMMSLLGLRLAGASLRAEEPRGVPDLALEFFSTQPDASCPDRGAASPRGAMPRDARAQQRTSAALGNPPSPACRDNHAPRA